MSLLVYLAALNDSARSWDDQHQDLRGATRSLSDMDTLVLGPRVQAAADRFVDTWLTEIKRLEVAATDHAQALRDTARLFDQSDSDVVERSQQLMSWANRDTSPTGLDR